MTPKERLQRAPLGYISHSLKTHLSSINDTNSVKLSALTFSGGEYLIKINIGTPEVEFIATADTGSDLIWVQCSPCDACITQPAPLFNPATSSTYQEIPCTSPICRNTDLTTSCDSDSESPTSQYNVLYGDNTESNGTLSIETISFPSPDATTISLPSTVFGCGFSQTGDLSQGEGLVGLGTGPSSLISQLGPSINNKFSYCLAPPSSKVASKLTFGEDVTGPGVVSTPLQPSQTSNFYFLSLDGISVGDSLQVPVGLDIVIDSGSTLTSIPASAYSGIRDAMASAIGLDTVRSPVDTVDLCYNAQLSDASGQFSPPDVVFQFKGADVVLKAVNTFWQVEDDVVCLAMQGIGPDGIFIFGNIAQINFQVGYDLQASQVSFAPADCTNN